MSTSDPTNAGPADPGPPDPDTPAPDALAVEAVLADLRRALAEQGHAVLVAPPGAGKTTIVPLRLLDEPWLAGRRIVVLEPRRLATRAAARRMAALLGEEVGGTAGYQTRDERRIGPTTRIEVVTEGILTRRLQHDPGLAGVGLVVFDELHERNLQSDLGLALALDTRRHLRPDLRLLAMSATLQHERVAAALGGDGPAPVIVAERRAHPVTVRWLPPGPRDRPDDAVTAAVHRALRDDEGDVLVFLPGAGEINRVAGLLRGSVAETVDVRTLYGALSLAEQDLALAPSPPGRRRVVLATDIAETSLTVAGVRVVVDGGTARAPRFDPRTGMTRLRTVPISRSSAEQRAGRAGRTAPGTAYRLWSKLEHGARRAHADPEITQVDLAGLALELALWGADPAELTFLDPPPARTLVEARTLLTELGALDDDGHVTPVGRAMAALPLHPRLAHLVVAAEPADRWLACLLAVLLDERDVLRGRPDDLPADLGLRVRLLAEVGQHPLADRRAVEAARARARDLARRAGVEAGPVEPEHAGRVLALAYPDRLAVRRGSPGRFQLRGGTTAWVRPDDPLAGEAHVVAADLDGKRKDARIRLGAALDADDVAVAFAGHVRRRRELVWDRDRDDLVERIEQVVGGLRLGLVERRPSPGPDTVAALVDRARATKLAALAWSPAATALRARLGFLRCHLGEPWPDVSDRVLLGEVDQWLPPFLHGATGRADLEAVDVAAALRARVDPRVEHDLDRLAPTHVVVPSGRRVPLDYDHDPPVLAVRVQELFGSDVTPSVLGGRVPVVLHLLSPAGRPLQVTSDLAGFWRGSWRDVRKEMAGRYPKHAWPEDPVTARPPGRSGPAA